MKAMVIQQLGTNNDAFQLVDLEKPTVKANHVLIKVEATSVNPLVLCVAGQGLTLILTRLKLDY